MARMDHLMGFRDSQEAIKDRIDLLMSNFWLSLIFIHIDTSVSISPDYILQNLNRIILIIYFQMYDHLNIVSDHPHIPQEAFLFIPHRAASPQERDDYKVGEGKNIRRLLFEGNAVETYTPYELEKLEQFESYLKKKNITLDPRWDKAWKMRFMLSTGCNYKKCVNDMAIFIEYQQKVKNPVLTSSIGKHLKDGVFYMNGRDSHYRPILVFDVQKIIKSGMSQDELIQTQTYFFEYVMRNFLIPGQVQNWVAIIDANEIGVFSLVGAMRKSFTFLSDTFRSRMFVCYVVRIPSSISFVWGIVKNFLEEETVRKINFFDEQTIEPLLDYCHPSQLEQKFGGELPNIKQGHLWPPRQWSNIYKCSKEPTKIITKKQYTELYKTKRLYNTKFHEENIITEVSKQQRENVNHITLKRLEKQFKIQLEMCNEDSIDFEKDVKPFADLKPSLNFFSLISKNIAATTKKN